MNWYDADEYCANKGGFLAEPMTSEENNFLLGYAPTLGNVNWWTGNLPSVQARTITTQIREQMSGPDLHVFTLKFHSNFSPKKKWFFHFFGLKKKFSKFFL